MRHYGLWMGFEPQHAGSCDGIKSEIAPPRRFIAAAVNLAVLSPTQRDDELIADLASKGAALGKSQVVSIRRLSATDQARAFSDRPHVVAVTKPAGL